MKEKIRLDGLLGYCLAIVCYNSINVNINYLPACATQLIFYTTIIIGSWAKKFAICSYRLALDWITWITLVEVDHGVCKII